MGRHFIPQRYLRNFEDTSRPGFVWVPDKRKGEIRQAAIDHVAQSKNFYTETTESRLAQEVEAPGNKVMRKLLNNIQIDFAERKILAYYVGVMLRRVPATRKRAKDMMPTALAGLIAEIREHFNSFAKDPRATPELLERRHRELDDVAAKFSRQPPWRRWNNSENRGQLQNGLMVFSA